jgi:hypothetical protein
MTTEEIDHLAENIANMMKARIRKEEQALAKGTETAGESSSQRTAPAGKRRNSSTDDESA